MAYFKTETSSRWLPIFPQLEELVRPYWERRAAEAGPGALLFPGVTTTPDGQARMPSSWRNFKQKCCTLAGISHLTHHELRHTFISHAKQLTRGGAPILGDDVSAWAGHKNTRVTDDVYTHVLDEEEPWRGEHLEFRVERFLGGPEFVARDNNLRRAYGLPEVVAGCSGGSNELPTPSVVA